MVDILTDELLSINEVCKLLKVTRRTLETKRKEGKFPEPSVYVFESPKWTIRCINEWLSTPKNKV